MMTITPTKLKRYADKAGISIAGHDGSPYATLEQLAAFAAEVQAGLLQRVFAAIDAR